MNNEDVVLDLRTGLPAVIATRSEDGHLTFRKETVKVGGGMRIARPLSDSELAAMYRGATPASGVEEQGAAAGRAVAESLRSAEERDRVRARELEAQLEDACRELEAERQANVELGGRCAEVEAERDAAVAQVRAWEERWEAAQRSQEPSRRGPGRPRSTA